ncbi:MAG: hypothetical protein KKG59_01660 [Nanoarchaeota archaeon]|nr:hypothetical protein [Nanoarchaeota archaeon]
MINCPNKERNMEECTCTYEGCERKGICCECVHYHRKKGAIPGCFFSTEGECTFDRSIIRFVEDQEK